MDLLAILELHHWGFPEVTKKESEETLHHFPFHCTGFWDHFNLHWSSLTNKVIRSDPTDGSHMSDVLVNLDQHQRVLSLLIGRLPLPFDSAIIMTITRFVASLVSKIYKLRKVEAPWITQLVLCLDFQLCTTSIFQSSIALGYVFLYLFFLLEMY